MNTAVPTALARKTLWREHSAKLARGEAQPNLRIGLAASFTANSLVPFIGAPLLEAGLSPSIQVGPYNQLFQVCLNPSAHFQGELDVLVLVFRLEDLASDEIFQFVCGTTAAIEKVYDKVDQLASALHKLRSGFAGTIIAGLPPLPSGLPVASAGLDPRGLGQLHRLICDRFLRQTQDIPTLRICDLDAVQRDAGLAASFDARQYYLYRQPFTDAFLNRAGALLGRMMLALKRAPKKCIVLDCDNTLWGGIIGEDGLGGIKLGDEFPGTAYRDFQKLLLYWRSQGVMLTIASKNNEADVWEVFDRHSSMVLKREHIVAWQIGWEPKSAGIPKLAQALNIGSDSMVFIDDNPAEIGYMQAARPEVQSILLPEEPAHIVQTLRALTCFDRLEITEEDRQRSDMMRAETQRAAAGSELSQEDFERSLELKLDFFRAGAPELDRVTQLINKTNQFNLTTVRRTVDEVRQLMDSGRYRVHGLRVADKYGEYGLTGVVIAEILADQSRLYIDTLLLSCRVLGRGVDTALLSAIADEARAAGLKEITAAFRPTEKNAPAAAFLPNHAFQAAADGSWIIAVDAIPPVRPWITLTASNG
jgi:FkbH-like protein